MSLLSPDAARLSQSLGPLLGTEAALAVAQQCHAAPQQTWDILLRQGMTQDTAVRAMAAGWNLAPIEGALQTPESAGLVSPPGLTPTAWWATVALQGQLAVALAAPWVAPNVAAAVPGVALRLCTPAQLAALLQTLRAPSPAPAAAPAATRNPSPAPAAAPPAPARTHSPVPAPATAKPAVPKTPTAPPTPAARPAPAPAAQGDDGATVLDMQLPPKTGPDTLETSALPVLNRAEFVDIQPLGAGGMAEVTLVNHTPTGQRYALKRLHTANLGEADVARFVREIKAGASLAQHPTIVGVLGYGFEPGGGLFMLSEFLPGGTLSRMLNTARRLPPPVYLQVAYDLLSALQAAHQAGITHRDIKPSNLLWSLQGRLKLADFGIALGAQDDKLTQTNGLVGTPGYLAPEQLLGNRGLPASDLFSAAVVIYECVTGRNPFSVKDNLGATFAKIVNHRPSPMWDVCPLVNPELEYVVESLLEKDPKNRMGVDEALAHLQTAIRNTAVDWPVLMARVVESTGPACGDLAAQACKTLLTMADQQERQGANAASMVLNHLAVDFLPDDAQAKRALARRHSTMGGPPPEEADFVAAEEALAASPGNVAVLKRCADMARARGHTLVASRTLREYLKLRPNDSLAVTQLGTLLPVECFPFKVQPARQESTADLVRGVPTSSALQALRAADVGAVGLAHQTGNIPGTGTQQKISTAELVRGVSTQAALYAGRLPGDQPVPAPEPVTRSPDQETGRVRLPAKQDLNSFTISINPKHVISTVILLVLLGIVGVGAKAIRGAMQARQAQKDKERLKESGRSQEMLKAEQALEQNQPGEAVEILNKVISSVPSSALRERAMFLRAQGFMQMKEYTLARVDLDYLLTKVTDSLQRQQIQSLLDTCLNAPPPKPPE